MQDSTVLAQPSSLRRRLTSALAIFAMVFGFTIVFAPAAHAADPTCRPTQASGACGQVINNGSKTIKIARNYTGNGTVAGPTSTVAAGKSTFNTHRTSAGWVYDWDAIYVPAGSCAKIWAGAFHAFLSYDNRVGKSGVWHKVDGFGVTASIKTGSCP